MKRLFQRVLLLFLVPFLWVSSSWGQANVVGQWTTLPYQMPINPVHGILLNTGKVLIVSGSGWVAGNNNYLAAVWDPIAGTIIQQSLTWDMFCNGIAILPDGRPFVVSGTLQYDPFEGLVNTAVYSPATGQFTNMQNLAHGRWYPTATILGDGRLMTFSGLTETGSTNSTVEIYTVGTGWSPQYASPFTPPLYPWLHLLPNGNVFFSGSSPTSAIFNPTTDTWTTKVATTNYGGTRTYGTSVLLPLTPANGYKPVVMIMGGANPATATTELIDLSVSNPKWVYGPSMSQPRIEMSSVILPTGKVLALGGSINDEDVTTAGLNADLYDPVSNTFSAAGTNAYAHLYHSIALLMPDATVMITGGNPVRGTYEPHMEVYSPAYLFTTNSSGQAVAAVRPTITSVSSSTLSYGGAFKVTTPDAANISSVVLMRPGADTHAFNMEQRLVGLSFTAGSGVLNVTAPPTSNIAPPGYYMMFLLNSSGVPSVANFVQLPVTGSLQPPTGAITSPAANATIGVGQSVSFAGTGTDPNPNGSITGYSWVFPGGTPATSTVQNPGAVTFSAAGTDVASLTVTDNNGLSDPNPPTRTVTVVPNFALSATPASQPVPVGSSTSYTTTITPGTGFTGTVSFGVSGLPTGATASFNPATVTASGSSTLNVATLATTPTGTYTLTITGTSGALTQRTTVTLVVNATVDFSLSTSPSSQSVIQGNSNSFTASVTSLGGFSGSTTFSVSGLPSGVTATFSPTSVIGSGSTTLNLVAAATATTGAYTLTVTGTSGSLTHNSTTNLLVLSSGSPTLVSIAVTPASASILAGGTQQYAATGTYSDSSTQNLTSSVTWTSSTPGTATINSAGLATGVAGGSTTIQAASGAISGSAPLTVTGTLSGLVGHWNFDAGSGTTAVDSSGNGYTATLYNGVTWVPGEIGDAISANTTNQYAGTTSINLSATSAVTVALWVNRTYTSGGTNGTTLFEFSSNFNNYNNAFAFFPDEAPDCGVTAMEIGIDGNSGYNIKCYSQPTSGVWHHLAVVYDMTQAAANEVTLYIDGVLQTALKQTYSSNNTGKFGTYPLYLFSRAGTTSFSGGEMDDLQLYNRALAASEVQQIYSGAAASPDFTLSSSPASQTVSQGASTTYTSTVTAANGFGGAVAFTVSGLPTGATGTFNPTSVTGSGTSTLTVATAATTPTGTYPLTITGTSGSLVHAATATLVVSAPVDFTLTSASTYQTVNAGSSTTNVQTITPVNGFSGAVTFSVSGLPTGATGTFNPTSVIGSGTSTLTIATTTTTLIGTYTVTITGTSGSLVNISTVTLEVNASPDFTLSSSPSSQTVAQGAGTTYTPTVAAVNGFSGVATFSVSGLPTGAAGTFNPTSVTGSGTSTLSVTTASTTPTGTYTVTITGTSGSLVHTTTATLVVSGTPSFTLASSPASQSVIQGGSTTYTPTVTATGGFNSSVAFTVSGLPTGATGTFNPTSVTGSGTSTLTVKTASTTPTGTYTLTIKGTSGSLVQTSTATLAVSTPGVPGGVDNSYVTVSACNAPAQSCTTYVGSTVPTGDAIMIVASWGGATTTATVSDGVNTYTPVSGPINAAIGPNRGQVWIAKSSGPGVTQATVALSAPSAGAEILIWAIPLTGIDPTSPIDANVTNFTAGNGTSMSTGTSGVASAVPNEMIWGVFLEDNYSTPFAPSSGYTSISGQEAVSLLEYKNVTQTGTQSATGTNGTGSNNWIGLVFGLKAPGQTSSPTLTSIAVTPANPSIVNGGTQQFTATGTYSDSSTQNLSSSATWTSGTTSVATIASGGLATSVSSGTSTIQATSGSISGSTVLTVTASAAPDFTLTSSPASQTVVQGGGTTFTPAVTGINGFSGVVAFSVSGLPTGATSTFNPTSVTGSGTSTLSVSTAANTPTGTFTLTITATSGALTHSTTSTLVVSGAAASTFTLTATPTSRTITAGSSTTYSVSMTIKTGFSGTVTFGVTGLPSGATGSYNRTTRTSSGSTTLTVATNSSAAPGTYPLTITGTDGGQIQTVGVTLVLSGPPSADVSPSPLPFGSVTTGTNTTLNLTVTNTGAASLSGGKFTFGGGTPQPYTRITSGTFPAGAPNCSTTLAVGASCTVKVQFAPTTATTFNRTLTVAYTGATVTGSPVSLTGTGVTTGAAAVLTVSPTSINFGSVPRGSTSTTPGNITVSDTGTISLTGLTITDPDPTHFSGTGNTCGTTLAPGVSCTISGQFIPGNTLGTVTTTLTISSSNGGTQTVSLSGTGT